MSRSEKSKIRSMRYYNANKSDPIFMKKRLEYAKSYRKNKIEKLLADNAVIIEDNDQETIKDNIVPTRRYVKNIDPIVYYDNKNRIVLHTDYFKQIEYLNEIIPKWVIKNDPTLKADKIASILKNLNIIFTDYLEKDFNVLSPIIYKVLENKNNNVLSGDEILVLLDKNNLLADDVDSFKETIIRFAKLYIKNPKRDTPYLYTFIEYINSILAVLSRVKNINTNGNYKTISNIYNRLKYILLYGRRECKVKYDNNGKLKEFDWADKGTIYNLLDTVELSPTTAYNKSYIALASLYLLFPPRRLEYIHLILIDNIENIENSNKNYLLVDENKNITKLIFNIYKQNNSYGHHIYDISENVELIKYLSPHIMNVRIGNYVFGNKTGTTYIYQANMCRRITTIFKKLYGIELTTTDIRLSAEAFNKNTKGRTDREKSIFNIMMGSLSNI